MRPLTPPRWVSGPLTSLFAVGLLAAACSDGAASVSVTPARADVGTCRARAFTAAPADGVTWSVSGGGTIDGAGNYLAPKAPPAGPVTVTAARAGATGSASVRVATAFPGAAVSVGEGQTTPALVRAVAARSDRVYALLQRGRAAFLAKSTDGGKTFPVVSPLGGDVAASIAIDAAEVDTVYITLHRGDDQAFSALDLATSTDGGATFTRRALYEGGNGDVTFADVASPAAGVVVVTAPTSWQDGDGGQGGELLVFHDAAKGATLGPLNELKNGYGAKAASVKVLSVTGNNLVETNDGRYGPQLATASGRLCLTYAEYGVDGGAKLLRLRCSSDGGVTFAAPVTVASGPPDTLHRPRLTLSADGALAAVAWNSFTGNVDSIGATQIAVSSDGGATFGPPTTFAGVTVDGNPRGVDEVEALFDGTGVLWVARKVGDAAIAVDKSCDRGATWSGAVPLPVVGTHRQASLYVSSQGVGVSVYRAEGGATLALPLLE